MVLKQKPFIIGITGGTGSGKTFVIEAIKDRFDGQVLVISQDQYYKGRRVRVQDRWERANEDEPAAFDNELLVKHLKSLIAGKTVMAPVYDYRTHLQLKNKTPLEPRPVIILEGILILQNLEIRELLDHKVFLDASPDIRLARRLLRDIEERGVSIANLKGTIEWYMENVKPMHDKFIEPVKKYADDIYNTDKGSIGAAMEVKELVKQKLIEHGVAPIGS